MALASRQTAPLLEPPDADSTPSLPASRFRQCAGLALLGSFLLAAACCSRPVTMERLGTHEFTALSAEAVMIEKDIKLGLATISYAERPASGTADELPLVLLHGFLESWRSWTNVIPSMAAGRRIIAVTLRGWGDSSKLGKYTIDAYARDVHSLLRELGIGRCVLGGHSMGTMISTLVAARHPEVVAGLVLCSGAAKMNPKHVVDRSSGLTMRGIGEYINKTFPDGHLSQEGLSFLRSFQLADLKPFLKSGTVRVRLERQVMNETLKATPRSYRDAWSDMLQEDHIGQLASIATPVLTIWGTADYIFDSREQQRLHVALSGARVTARNVTGSPHGVIWTDGPLCAEHIGRWLADVGL